jgi:hypothetical protein
MYEFEGLEKMLVATGFVVGLIILGLFVQYFWI